MHNYQENEILKIAKRINNFKRPYLLVNPLQAKHIPVSPSKALKMMTSLGKLVAEKFSETRLVIGFAETATAIGAVVARSISDECLYIHTTRENVNKAKGYVFFNEEHSHATEQKLVSDHLGDAFSRTETIVLVDDEFSTGKTLINMINCLKTRYPAIDGKRIVAASIINRLSEDNLQKWADEGIESVCLLKLDNSDYSSAIDTIEVKTASANTLTEQSCDKLLIETIHNIPDPRLGIIISDYYDFWIGKEKLIEKHYNLHGKRVLILGTEECMLPALLIGKAIENAGDINSIKCHSTTRSPIGICNISKYPIKTGNKFHSLYDSQRDTYIYNLHSYDVVLIISDANIEDNPGLYELGEILKQSGCQEILCLAGDNYV